MFLDQLTIEEPIFSSIEPCITFIKKNIALGSTIGEIYREDRWEYPLKAVREAVINAVVHRDYSILGGDIKVAIYDDMIEITSPGPLPDLLSFDELGSGRSEIRNRVIAPIFKDMTLIEGWGTGFQKMKEYLSEYPELNLVLQEVGYAFQVQFIKKSTSKASGRDQVGAKLKTGKGPSQGRVRAESGAKQGLSKDQVGAKLKTGKGPSQGRVRAESMKEKILSVLTSEPLSRAEISAKLGFKGVPGHIGRALRDLLAKGLIEFTIPEKPNSRMQKYRLKE